MAYSEIAQKMAEVLCEDVGVVAFLLDNGVPVSSLESLFDTAYERKPGKVYYAEAEQGLVSLGAWWVEPKQTGDELLALHRRVKKE
ncbi:MAG TPA: hypothetical protein VLH19_01950 [Patescibacteria group bacterium]|nr:hypothetical protein [Patescibacteria group bacterium]